MASESVHDQIAEAFRTGFAGIRAGADYWFDVDLCDRVAFYPEHLEGGETIYLLRAGDEEHTEEQSSGGMEGLAEFFLLVARRYDPASEQPGQQDAVRRATLVNRLVRDALRYLLQDVQLAGLAENVVNGSLFVNRDLYTENYAVAELRFQVRYSYLSTAP